MNNKDLEIVAILIIFLFLVACSSAPTGAIPQIQFTSTEQIDTPTPTKTPRPTNTSTVTPTATFTPWPTKDVLLQFGIFGGDGGWEHGAFVGRDMPKLILYTDGQLIIQKEDEKGVWFEETALTNTQMCSFLSQIEKAGFYSLEINNSSSPGFPTDNPIYKFDDTAQFSEGGPSYFIQVNGKNPRQIPIYYRYVEYLIPKAKQIFNLFNYYSPPSKLTEYQAQYMLLRIEKGLGNSVRATPEPIIQTWPAHLPPLEVLAKENIETQVSAYLPRYTDNPVSQVLVNGKQAQGIFEVFENRLAYKLFQSGGNAYYVAARPFLPHETLNSFSRLSNEKEFNLPFNCSN